MPKFYGSFGVGTSRAKYVQPIVAENYDTARKIMFKLYGSNFCTVYDKNKFIECVEKGYFPDFELYDEATEEVLKQESPVIKYVHCASCFREINAGEICYVNNDTNKYYCSVECVVRDISGISQVELSNEEADCQKEVGLLNEV